MPNCLRLELAEAEKEHEERSSWRDVIKDLATGKADSSQVNQSGLSEFAQSVANYGDCATNVS